MDFQLNISTEKLLCGIRIRASKICVFSRKNLFVMEKVGEKKELKTMLLFTFFSAVDRNYFFLANQV